MEVETQQTIQGPVSRSFVRDGVAGNYEILLEMVRVIRDSVNKDIGLKKLTADLLINNNLNSYSPAVSQLSAIYNFVKANVQYVQDQAGLIESIKSARVTLADGYGDCDDLTNTVASMVGSIGFEDVRLCMAKYSPNDASFVHVYPVVYANNQRIVMDATIPNGQLGDEAEAFELKEIPIFSEVKGLDGISGLFNNVKYHAKRLGKTVIETVPVAADFLPLGFVSSTAFATGARLISDSTSGELSLNAIGSKINQELDKIIVALIRSQIALNMAQSHALQVASQLSTMKDGRNDLLVYPVVKKAIQDRLVFINNFETFAQQNHIPVVKLNPSAMLATGVAGAGVGAFILYKIWKEKKRG